MTSFAINRIYLDELDQYRNDMNKEMLEYYGIDKDYEHKDEFNETNKMLAEDLAFWNISKSTPTFTNLSTYSFISQTIFLTSFDEYEASLTRFCIAFL